SYDTSLTSVHWSGSRGPALAASLSCAGRSRPGQDLVYWASFDRVLQQDRYARPLDDAGRDAVHQEPGQPATLVGRQRDAGARLRAGGVEDGGDGEAVRS